MVGDDLMGALGPDIAPMAKGQRPSLRNVLLSKVDRAESIMTEARKQQTVLDRTTKRSKEVAAIADASKPKAISDAEKSDYEAALDAELRKMDG